MSEPRHPLLSVIIPCHNHGRYLADAIQSCLDFKYDNLEILVIDDGSTDDTEKVARSFPEVHYHYKDNEGLPAARNTGIDLSSGEYICFLDADDWYKPRNLLINLQLLIDHPQAAFISGCHEIMMEDGSLISHCFPHQENFYIHLLETNFIGNPSTVIYRRSTLENYRFDTSLKIKGCEDYDHYLRISRDNEIIHNPLNISVYRKHAANMSNNYALMLNSALNVLLDQKSRLRNEEEWEAWRLGWNKWVKFYGYFPVKTIEGRKLTRDHWELLKKYKLKFPIIVMKKIFSIVAPD